MLEDTETWLYEDGEDQPKQVYEEKLAALKVGFISHTPRTSGDFCYNQCKTCVYILYMFYICVIYVQRLGQPIQDRHREHEDRPRAFEELGKKVQLYMKFVDSYKQKVSPFQILQQ